MPTMTQLPDLGPAGDLSASIAGIVTLVILALGALAWRRLGSVFAEMRTDVRATKIQTVNSHETNLRDDLTEAITKIDSLATSVGEMKSGMERLDTRQTAMHEDLRETRKDLRFATEYTRDVDKRVIRLEARGKGGDDGVSD